MAKASGENQERYSRAARMIWAVIGTRSSKGSLASLASSPVEKDIFEIMGQICLGVAATWMCPPKKGNAADILGRDPLGKEHWAHQLWGRRGSELPPPSPGWHLRPCSSS